MFTFSFFEGLRSLFTPAEQYSTLDAFIAAGKPQSTHDVERLERQFDEMQRRRNANFYKHFHE